MHTARQLNTSDFSITIDGAEARREDLFPHWGPLDRFGIVVHAPFGAVGASHLIQLAATAFYDSKPARRDGFPTPSTRTDPRAIYPEIYLFHVGGRWGNHSDFDFWPARKEVFLPANPLAVLDAVNDRAISRLAVPDETVVSVEHEFKEPAAAADRTANAWAYSASGRVTNADIEIAGLSRRTETNAKNVLNADGGTGRMVAQQHTFASEELLQRSSSYRKQLRVSEAQDGLDHARTARDRLRTTDDGLVRETYRRITVQEAIFSLVPRG